MRTDTVRTCNVRGGCHLANGTESVPPERTNPNGGRFSAARLSGPHRICPLALLDGANSVRWHYGLMDPVAEMLLSEAAPLGSHVLVVDDVDGAVTRAVAAAGSAVSAYCDDARERAALGAAAVPELRPEVIAVVDQVLVRLPKSAGALDELSELVAGHGGVDVRLVGAGRVKHMSRAMNASLARSFTDVRASLGRSKCRALHASGPRHPQPTWPRRGYIEALDLHVVAHGGVFAGTRLDAGTRLLLANLPVAPGGVAIDVGSGSGIIATWLARRGDRVTAIDVSAAAVRSTAATAAANGVLVSTHLADGLTDIAPASADVIVTNPPFHDGAAKQTGPTAGIFAAAGRVLRPGGQLWTVFNSHLPYLSWLRRDVGPTRVVAQDRSYTVTRSTARSG